MLYHKDNEDFLRYSLDKTEHNDEVIAKTKVLREIFEKHQFEKLNEFFNIPTETTNETTANPTETTNETTANPTETTNETTDLPEEYKYIINELNITNQTEAVLRFMYSEHNDKIKDVLDRSDYDAYFKLTYNMKIDYNKEIATLDSKIALQRKNLESAKKQLAALQQETTFSNSNANSNNATTTYVVERSESNANSSINDKAARLKQITVLKQLLKTIETKLFQLQKTRGIINETRVDIGFYPTAVSNYISKYYERIMQKETTNETTNETTA